MKTIKLNNIDIPYTITKKKNKNTYFYFKKDGYIQINLSRYQTIKDALNYMKQNSGKFVARFNNHMTKSTTKEGIYSFLGKEYTIVYRENKQVELNHQTLECYSLTTDVEGLAFKAFEKNQMLTILRELKHKYNNNPYIDINDIKIKTRYTTSRHGSCNAKKKNININLNLIKYDIKFIEYVFLHEISHLVHQNHSKDFYYLFEKLCPNYKELRRELKYITR
jgi:predicted metal-dependent hydrolase